MRIDREGFEKLLSGLAEAWSAKDYDKAASYFAEDIRYKDPLRYSFDNRADLLKFFEDDDGYPQVTVWHNVLFDESGQRAAVEYSYRGTHLYHGVVLVKLNDNLISRWREYQHTSELDWESFWSGIVF